MPLPLPYTVQDEAAQGNFDHIKTLFPLSRRHMKIETPNIVGTAGQPAFNGTWVNYDASAWRAARFWKDPMGIVWLEGLVALGTIGTTIFTLPAGYRPGSGMMWATSTSTGYGRVDVAPTGNVVSQSGGNGYFSLSVIDFKQEA